jgi:hypothetical protein
MMILLGAFLQFLFHTIKSSQQKEVCFAEPTMASRFGVAERTERARALIMRPQ